MEKELSHIEIDFWCIKDPLLARFMRLMTVVYIKEFNKVEFVALDDRLTCFMIQLSLENARSFFTNAIKIVIRNKLALEEILIENSPSKIPYRFCESREPNLKFPIIDYIENRSLIEKAYKVLEFSASKTLSSSSNLLSNPSGLSSSLSSSTLSQQKSLMQSLLQSLPDTSNSNSSSSNYSAQSPQDSSTSNSSLTSYRLHQNRLRNRMNDNDKDKDKLLKNIRANNIKFVCKLIKELNIVETDDSIDKAIMKITNKTHRDLMMIEIKEAVKENRKRHSTNPRPKQT